MTYVCILIHNKTSLLFKFYKFIVWCCAVDTFLYCFFLSIYFSSYFSPHRVYFFLSSFIVLHVSLSMPIAFAAVSLHLVSIFFVIYCYVCSRVCLCFMFLQFLHAFVCIVIVCWSCLFSVWCSKNTGWTIVESVFVYAFLGVWVLKNRNKLFFIFFLL